MENKAAIVDREPTLVTEKEAADMLRLSMPTMRRMRAGRVGPAYYKTTPGLKGAVRYDRAEVLEWMQGQRVEHGGANQP